MLLREPIVLSDIERLACYRSTFGCIIMAKGSRQSLSRCKPTMCIYSVDARGPVDACLPFPMHRYTHYSKACFSLPFLFRPLSKAQSHSRAGRLSWKYPSSLITTSLFSDAHSHRRSLSLYPLSYSLRSTSLPRPPGRLESSHLHRPLPAQCRFQIGGDAICDQGSPRHSPVPAVELIIESPGSYRIDPMLVGVGAARPNKEKRHSRKKVPELSRKTLVSLSSNQSLRTYFYAMRAERENKVTR